MNRPTTATAIDANVILRYLVGDHEALSAKAAGILQAVERGETTVLCDPVTLAEAVWVLGSFYRWPNNEIVAGLEPIVKLEGFVVPDKDRYLQALRLFGSTVEHFRDACACATALEQCDGRLYSFDRKLSSAPGITRAEEFTDTDATGAEADE